MNSQSKIELVPAGGNRWRILVDGAEISPSTYSDSGVLDGLTRLIDQLRQSERWRCPACGSSMIGRSLVAIKCHLGFAPQFFHTECRPRETP